MIELLKQNIDDFRTKPMNIAKGTILLDHGYHPEKLQSALEAVYPQIMRKIRFERSPKPGGEGRICACGGALGGRAL